ncbi:MAG: hypothetical protein ACRC7N_19885 [Clostridium sp.]
MENMVKKDQNYLEGAYKDGYNKVKSALGAGIIPISFKEEVLGDILELFIRNQDGNKDFNEVVSGDINKFIIDIASVYAEETSTKTKVIHGVGAGIFVAGVFFGIDMLLNGMSTMAYLLMVPIVFVSVFLATLFSYKISSKTNPKNINYISGVVGFTLSIASNYLYDNVAFFNNLAKNELSIGLSIVMMIIMLVVGGVIIYKVEKSV